ncbi:MAG TPA: AMP-binding protein, partial [Acidimicrobiales bacterium]|nr:AMP-binding protein [Acidimicrobiales bacterium]
MTASIDELVAEYSGEDLGLAHVLCDRHPADAPAFTVVEADRHAVTLTYGQLRESSERLAAAFAELGLGPGDRIATL